MSKFKPKTSYVFSKAKYLLDKKSVYYHPDWLDQADGQEVFVSENLCFGIIELPVIYPSGRESIERQVVSPEDCEVVEF